MVELWPKIIKIDFLGKIDRSNFIPVSEGVRDDYGICVHYENGIVALFKGLTPEVVATIYNDAKMQAPTEIKVPDTELIKNPKKMQSRGLYAVKVKIVQTKKSDEYICKNYPTNYDIKNIIRPDTYNMYECHCGEMGIRRGSCTWGGRGAICESWNWYKSSNKKEKYKLSDYDLATQEMKKNYPIFHEIYDHPYTKKYKDFITPNEIQLTNCGENGMIYDINQFYTNGRLHQLIGLAEQDARILYSTDHGYLPRIFNYKVDRLKEYHDSLPPPVPTRLTNISGVKQLDNNAFSASLVYNNTNNTPTKTFTKAELRGLFVDNNLPIPDYLKRPLGTSGP
jgi:hypothetical protein